MVANYLKVAFRNITRKSGYSFINITGLAIGISVTILIGMWIHDEISFNTSNKNFDRIAQVYQHYTANGELNTSSTTPIPLAHELKTVYKNDFKHVVRVWWELNHTLFVGDRKVIQSGTFMDGEALEMLSFNMLKGSWQSLKEPASIVLSESAAKALFGDEDPMNQLVRIDNAIDVKVTGVYENLPGNSRFNTLQFISTWDLWVSSNYTWMKADENNWSSALTILVEIQPGTTFQDLSSKIKDIRLTKLNKEQALAENPSLFLQPMERWHLYPNWEGGKETNGRIQFLWLFGIIGTFVLLLACINFMNLSTAQSEKRAKEVGIRKSIGSQRAQLIYQFLAESILITFFAFVLALGIVTVVLPLFNDLADKRMSVLWSNLYFWIIGLGFIFITGLLSGSYPALYLSSFQPVKVLKGTFKAGRLASLPRKVLVVMQFTVSITLIIGTIIVWQQIQYAKNRPIGYTREGLIMIRKTSPDLWGKFDAIKNELLRSGAIINIAESSSPVTEIWFNEAGVNWEGKDPNQQSDFATLAVTHDFGATMGWEFTQGRDFSRDYSTDSSAVVLNETAVRFMGLKDPINTEIMRNGKKYKVIGVIKDMIMTSPYEPVKQTIFWLDYKENTLMNIRMNPLLSVKESLARIENVFAALFPAVPFDFKFTDDEYALKFAAEERIGKLASLFASLAIVISCLGLFGMSSFVAEQRKKEIGIRKILGASVVKLWKMLSLEFISLIIISCLLSIPLAWSFLSNWLENYEYHTEISIWVFILASAIALITTLLTISYQVIKVSIINPVKSLKSE
ncbi:ABC transporter permease [Chryseolinea sp. H1M3-3]|uniref:ABC transporter permease n=1 Tax=Chryseolinea sp. H1M3-3 TaxID=3034144 RepID=UPI0023EB804C|nr:ABC transporter permease [Chryseolinea sp. H1M3-3]